MRVLAPGADMTGTDLTGGTGIGIASETNTLSGDYSATINCNLEGIELISTNETGGTKFLREDGDNTCSWQTITATTKADLDVDHLITLSGVSDASDKLGTFTGSTITDNRTNKQALQECETAIETKVALSGNETIAGNKTFSGDTSFGTVGFNGVDTSGLATIVAEVDASIMGASATANGTAINEMIAILKTFGFMAGS